MQDAKEVWHFKFGNLDEFEELMKIAKSQMESLSALLNKLSEFEFEMVMVKADSDSKMRFFSSMDRAKM